ncbi:Random slug protein 5 [Tetrabaena socialis]|uniref:Random slug protein 5 n=1 Tax=Tetrabaena socialis TaxID=47790 RepID=A0A2J8ABL7_9CHLO|nr:Random slug protein 5 [Tetrabaena socialis]|eukprot:PNH09922.1 Random slug protein 5 [Tetrabaena socialis]
MAAAGEEAVAAVLAELEKLGGELSEPQRAACDAPMVRRYLAARGGSVQKAARMLLATLKWREEFGFGTLSIAEFSGTASLQSGRMYVAGNDPSGKSVLVTRKRADAFQPSESASYLRYLAFTLETCARAMQGGQEKWVWLMDMRGYSRANSPPLGVSMATLRILADHFPERLHRCFFIDAPSIFSFLFNALWPFVDPVTRGKIVFINSKEHSKHVDAVAAAGSDSTQREEALRLAADPADPDAFCNYIRWYCAPYDEAAFRTLLQRVGWQ